jgi:Holliday junction resolvase-like predicted endonuclease
MTSVDTGRKAEAAAALFLRRKGCEVVEQNWRTRWCEIDIVATRDNVLYLCEVKYRARNLQGGGAEYITPKKLTQMRFAAEFWAATHDWQGEYDLRAIEVSGKDFRITGVFTDL